MSKVVDSFTLIKQHDEIFAGLKCPHCRRGTQFEEKNCYAGYRQYRCVRCGYVEPYADRSGRAIMIMVRRDQE